MTRRPDGLQLALTLRPLESTSGETQATELSTGPLKSRARALAASTPPKLRLAYAQSFMSFVVSHYWSKLSPRPSRTIRPAPSYLSRPLDREALAVAAALAELAATRPIEDAGYLIGSTYAAMLPEDYRSEHGVFYTPPTVVSRLLDLASAAGVDWNRCRVLDPACGGGAFLGPVAQRMIASLKGCDRRVLLRNLTTRLAGFEIDAFAAWLSLIFLDATLNELVGFSGDDQFRPIEVCDSLTRHEVSDFDLVVGNPPYGRIKLSPELRGIYKRSLYGHANLYGVFLDLALRKTRPGGIVAYVAPTSFLCGEYYKNLRALLTAEAAPSRWISFRSGRASSTTSCKRHCWQLFVVALLVRRYKFTLLKSMVPRSRFHMLLMRPCPRAPTYRGSSRAREQQPEPPLSSEPCPLALQTGAMASAQARLCGTDSSPGSASIRSQGQSRLFGRRLWALMAYFHSTQLGATMLLISPYVLTRTSCWSGTLVCCSNARPRRNSRTD